MKTNSMHFILTEKSISKNNIFSNVIVKCRSDYKQKRHIALRLSRFDAGNFLKTKIYLNKSFFLSFFLSFIKEQLQNQMQPFCMYLNRNKCYRIMIGRYWTFFFTLIICSIVSLFVSNNGNCPQLFFLNLQHHFWLYFFKRNRSEFNEFNAFQFIQSHCVFLELLIFFIFCLSLDAIKF